MQILLVDDHPLYREGLRSILTELGMELHFQEINDIEQLRSSLESNGHFDLVILGTLAGLRMEELPGLITDLAPGKILLVVDEKEGRNRRTGLSSSGIAAVIPRVISADLLKNIVQLILAGGVWSAPESGYAGSTEHSPDSFLSAKDVMNSGVLESQYNPSLFYPRVQLTPRQQEVLERMADGLKNREIARQLSISEFTVKLHVTSILRIFRVDNRIQAINRAREMGVI